MNLETSYYPYNPQLEMLPFRLTGIGGSRFQKHIDRPDGYMWHQILYCADGRGWLKYNGSCYELKPGSYVFLPKDFPHEYYPETDSWEVNWVCFDGHCCDETLALLGFNSVLVIAADEMGGAESFFDKMAEAYTTDVLYSGYTCSGLLYEYILSLKRLLISADSQAKSRHISVLMPALKYIHENYQEDISMNFLACLANITPQHLCRLFKSAFALRPNEYLNNVRIEKAFHLLKEGHSVNDIASECGFRDPRYFSTVFRQHTGMTPSEYKKGPDQKRHLRKCLLSI